MTRGRPPVQARDEAREIAKHCGSQVLEGQVQDAGCDFAIIGKDTITLVWVIRVRRFCISTDELAAVKTEKIREIRTFPRSPEISHELWMRSLKGSWRFFRIDETNIMEIQNEGRKLIAAAVSGKTVQNPAQSSVSPATAGQG